MPLFVRRLAYLYTKCCQGQCEKGRLETNFTRNRDAKWSLLDEKEISLREKGNSKGDSNLVQFPLLFIPYVSAHAGIWNAVS